MSDLRSRGIHWSTGAILDDNGNENNEVLWVRLIGGAPTIMTEDSARWQWKPTMQACPGSLVVWRIMPPHGKRPAELGWNADRAVDVALDAMREHFQDHGTWPNAVQLWNELDLNYERGDNRDDLNWEVQVENCGRISRFLGEALDLFRSMPAFANTRFLFPAWAAGHNHDNPALAAIWVPVAQRFDGAVAHYYQGAETIRAGIRWYQAHVRTDPNYLLVLGEWDMDGYPGDWIEGERETIGMLDAECARDPSLYACIFIERWAGSGRSEFDIYGNPRRQELWNVATRPPLAAGDVPTDPLPPPRGDEAGDGETKPPVPPSRPGDVPGLVPFDPSAPAVEQLDNYSCSAHATRWMLAALGRQPTIEFVKSSMIERGVMSVARGLEDATGRGLAAWITAVYGYETAFIGQISFGAVANLAGRVPMLIGGRRWGAGGHWVAVRGVSRSARGDIIDLLIANSADGYVWVHQSLSPADWTLFSDWSMVQVTGMGTAGDPPMTEYELFIRGEAARRGIDPDVAITVANSEGGVTEPAVLGDFSGPPNYSGKSWWAFQLHYGGAGYEDWGGSAGIGNSFTAKTGWEPGAENAWRDAARYALDAAKTEGWGPWYGAAAQGITGFDGIDQSVEWSGTPAGEWDYLLKTGVEMVTVTNAEYRALTDRASKADGLISALGYTLKGVLRGRVGKLKISSTKGKLEQTAIMLETARLITEQGLE